MSPPRRGSLSRSRGPSAAEVLAEIWARRLCPPGLRTATVGGGGRVMKQSDLWPSEYDQLVARRRTTQTAPVAAPVGRKPKKSTADVVPNDGAAVGGVVDPSPSAERSTLLALDVNRIQASYMQVAQQ